MKEKKTTQLNNPLKSLSIKVIALGLTLVILLTACIFMTVAWYTKMVSVTGLEFKTAEWDFTANYAISGIAVNVYEYKTITSDPEPLAAPGTRGYIPIKLSAWQSDTDVNFALTLDRSSMSEEFQKRIFFYYCTDAEGKVVNTETEHRVYLDGDPNNAVPDDEETVMEGYIEKEGQTEVIIFWEWLYEAPTGSTEEEIEAWDDFDTEVGKNPKLYIDEMNAKVSIAGVQVLPELKNDPPVIPQK